MKNLSHEELEYINEYVQNSGVEWYDLRQELVDHIAIKLKYLLDARGLDP